VNESSVSATELTGIQMPMRREPRRNALIMRPSKEMKAA
jgi:hypothetical protein